MTHCERLLEEQSVHFLVLLLTVHTAYTV
jgi:hypothetical protein